ncbi:MAG: tRNA-dihydrouridine synthase family protein [Lachnospiraceae bacterium]|nr:tRNA-dihydrouridine synthase family protein [Lachnospiraceae bacterium]
MKYYLAPMQSLTGFVFRHAYNKHFHNIDKYFTPFLADRRLNNKDKNEVLPKHNKGMHVIPQIMANDVEVFLEIVQQLEQYGYKEVNLNLGCPSGTVVPKKRGAGLLADLDMLDRFLEGIYDKSPLPISIKTRIGMKSPTEWEDIQTIYQKYPIKELIIHPRLQQDQYKNHPNLKVFEEALNSLTYPICYNGDLHSAEQLNHFTGQFPQVEMVMLGRGILKNPGLIGETKGKAPVTKEILLAFHNDVLEGYKAHIPGDINVLYKMKEWWCYLGESYKGSNSAKKLIKKIMKSKALTEYHALARQIIIEEKFQSR